jgi:hypothetical protein
VKITIESDLREVHVTPEEEAVYAFMDKKLMGIDP